MSGLWTTAFGLVVSVIIVGGMLANTAPTGAINYGAAAIAVPALAWTGRELIRRDTA